jgi:aerobic-type carbon monoxide dehydrogenase small subunit (CoxS/CutS family)
MIRTQVTLQVNGRDHEVWVRNDRTLLDVLHDDLGMPDVRYGCAEGVCGTCTVLLDGEPVSACTVYAVQAEGQDVVTLQGWSDPQQEPHPLQKCFLERGASQCGFCTAGMLLTAATMAERNPVATRDEIRHELVGNLCRCTGYQAIVDAVEDYLHLPPGSGTDGAASPQEASRADVPQSGQTTAGAAPEPVADPVWRPAVEGGAA